MATHELKTWIPFFKSVWDGSKNFEVRKDDRAYRTGDKLILHEYNAMEESYTGRRIRANVTYILRGGRFGVEEGYVVLALSVRYKNEANPSRSVKGILEGDKKEVL